MNNDLNYGGHLSAQPYGALYNFAEDHIVNFPADARNLYKTDAEKMIELVDRNRPALIVFGKSMFLYPEPIRQLKAFLHTVPGYRPLVMYDAAHVMESSGRICGSLEEGALVVTDRHKRPSSDPRGIIAANPRRIPLAEALVRHRRPHSQVQPATTTWAPNRMLAATMEMNAFKAEYQAGPVNARAFAAACATAGIPVEG